MKTMGEIIDSLQEENTQLHARVSQLEAELALAYESMGAQVEDWKASALRNKTERNEARKLAADALRALQGKTTSNLLVPYLEQCVERWEVTP